MITEDKYLESLEIKILALACSFCASVVFTEIPGSREDLTGRKYTLLTLSIVAAVLAFVVYCSEYVTGTGEEASFGRKRPIDICIHITTVLSAFSLLIVAILVLVQMSNQKWPDTKSELENCNNYNETDLSKFGAIEVKSFCEKLRLREFEEISPRDLCDEISEFNKIIKGSGKRSKITYKDDDKYCVRSTLYYLTTIAGLLGILTVLSFSVLQIIIFRKMRDD